MAYESDPDHFCYTLAVPVPGEDGQAPGDLWLGVLGEATPDEMNIFSESRGDMDFIAWPDENGVYCVVQNDVWTGWWTRDQATPLYRPSNVDNEARFEVGLPVGWMPPEPELPRMSVWERLVSNATGLNNNGKKVEKPATKRARKTKKKVV